MESKYRGSIYDFTDPNKVGRGCWYALLVITSQATTPKEKKYVCKQIRDITGGFFKCLECRQHSIEYLKLHPPENAVNKPDGLFNYIVDFMNEINARLGKPLYDRQIIFSLFHDDAYMACDKDCGDTEIRIDKQSSERSQTQINNSETVEYLTLEQEKASKINHNLPGLLVEVSPQRKIYRRSPYSS